MNECNVLQTMFGSRQIYLKNISIDDGEKEGKC